MFRVIGMIALAYVLYTYTKTGKLPCMNGRETPAQQPDDGSEPPDGRFDLPDDLPKPEPLAG